jgi:TetR/AcrR family tetracycline transcriptional repressor
MARPNIDQTTITRAAIAILKERGIEAVSLRNVAEAVGVKAPSLYWHVSDKAALFGLMSELLFREMLENIPACHDWQDWLRELGLQAWKTQRNTPDIHQLMMQSEMPPEVLEGFTARMVGELTARGMDERAAFQAQKSVLALTTGWTMMPNDPAFRDSPPDESFLLCLKAVISGYEIEARSA